MSIWQRISTLVKSNINALISGAEDPEKVLEQLIRDMRSQFIDARKQVAVSIADEKRLKKQYEGEVKKATDWEARAMTAIKANKEDLARQALGRKSEHDTLASQFQEQWMAQKAAADQLKDALTQLNAKIQEASRKKNLLIARQKRAEAQKKIQDTLSGMGDNSAFDTFARMEEKVDRNEAEAQAALELSGEMSGDSLDREFAALETSGGGQDDALAALKAKMGMAAPAAPAALPPAHAHVEALEEVEDLEAALEDL